MGIRNNSNTTDRCNHYMITVAKREGDGRISL